MVSVSNSGPIGPLDSFCGNMVVFHIICLAFDIVVSMNNTFVLDWFACYQIWTFTAYYLSSLFLKWVMVNSGS